jgi:hypothetical protein
MATVNANWQLPVYQVIGPVIRVHWDYSSYQSDEEWGEPYTIWEAQEAVVPLGAGRETFVSIINALGGNGEALADGYFT